MGFLKGENRVLYIKKSGVYYPIGCLTSNAYSDSSDMMDVTTRDVTDGWSSSRPVRQSYNISFSGLVADSSETGVITYAELQTYKRDRMTVEWKILSSDGDGSYDEGTGFINSISDSADAADSYVEFSGEIIGTGLPLSSSVPPIIDAKWIEIDDAWVYKGSNTNKLAIEVGDMIRRYTSSSRYIHAKVNALPYTTESNLSLFEDITVI